MKYLLNVYKKKGKKDISGGSQKGCAHSRASTKIEKSMREKATADKQFFCVRPTPTHVATNGLRIA